MRDREHQVRAGEAPTQGSPECLAPPAFRDGVFLLELPRGRNTTLRVQRGILHEHPVVQVQLAYRSPAGDNALDKRKVVSIRKGELTAVLEALRQAAEWMGVDPFGGRNGR